MAIGYDCFVFNGGVVAVSAIPRGVGKKQEKQRALIFHVFSGWEDLRMMFWDV